MSVIEITPTNIISCPDTTTVVSEICVRISNGNEVDITNCDGDTRFELQTITTVVPADNTACSAFALGFNMTSSIIGVVGVSLILAVSAIKIMRLAGEDG